MEEIANSLCNELESEGITYDIGADGPFICCEYCTQLKYYLKANRNNLRHNVYKHIGWNLVVANTDKSSGDKRKRVEISGEKINLSPAGFQYVLSSIIPTHVGNKGSSGRQINILRRFWSAS